MGGLIRHIPKNMLDLSECDFGGNCIIFRLFFQRELDNTKVFEIRLVNLINFIRKRLHLVMQPRKRLLQSNYAVKLSFFVQSALERSGVYHVAPVSPPTSTFDFSPGDMRSLVDPHAVNYTRNVTRKNW